MAAKADLTNKNNNFITRTTDAIVSLLDICERLNAIHQEYGVLDYGSIITDEVLAGSSSQHLDSQMFMDGFVSIEALQALFAEGHATNFARFRR